jgi:cytochrome c oxidase cbb3-type subunit 3
MDRIYLMIVGLASFLISAPILNAQDGFPEGVTEAMVKDGQAIFLGAGLCAVCHGMDGSGAIGPDLTDGEWLIGRGTYPELIEQITKGVSMEEATNSMGLIMPARGGSAITDDQVKTVAAYVWSLSHN